MNIDPTVINDNSNNDALVLETYLSLVDKENKFYIDIGSSYEFNLSFERIRDSSQTIFFECDPAKTKFYDNPNWNLPNFSLVTDKVSPSNVVSKIQAITDNTNPKLLDLDIDGYDFFVLEAFLEKISPSLLVAEINEKIPPPIKYTTKYWDEYMFNMYQHPSHGMSLSKFYELADKHNYDVINLTFNNVYAVRKDMNPGLKVFEAQELYDTFYKNPRLAGDAPMFHHNKSVDHVLLMEPEEAMDWMRNHYDMHGFQGFYELYL